MGALESPDRIYDAMLLPALVAIKRSRARGDITAEDERYALEAIRDIAEDIGEGRIVAEDDGGEEGRPAVVVPRAADGPPIPILAFPARDDEDEVALEMLARLLGPARWDIELLGPETLTAELLDLVAQRHPAAVCIAAIPPGGLCTPDTCARSCGRDSPS